MLEGTTGALAMVRGRLGGDPRSEVSGHYPIQVRKGVVGRCAVMILVVLSVGVDSARGQDAALWFDSRGFDQLVRCTGENCCRPG